MHHLGLYFGKVNLLSESVQVYYSGVSSPGPDGDAGLLPRSLQLVFRSVEERVSPHMAVKPHRCREFSRLTQEQQAEEALAKTTLLKQLKEVRRLSRLWYLSHYV